MKKKSKKPTDSTRFFVDPDEFQSLTFGTSVDQVAEIAGVSPGTVRRWLAGSSPIPYAVAQLFRLRCRGLVGPDWEDWRFGADGLLYHPQWRRGFTGRELAGMWITTQLAAGLRADLRQAQRDKAAQQAEIEQLEERVYFYRRQVRLEASLGLALVRMVG
ncbi:MAG: hypothetical protein PHX38_02800 [Sulfuricella sp.]|nr:hypothetical protein [Sulfuricella sp.]